MLHPSHDAPVQEWIEAGLAAVTQKARGKDLRKTSFKEAHANALVYLTGEGAQRLDLQGRQSPHFLHDLPE